MAVAGYFIGSGKNSADRIFGMKNNSLGLLGATHRLRRGWLRIQATVSAVGSDVAILRMDLARPGSQFKGNRFGGFCKLGLAESSSGGWVRQLSHLENGISQIHSLTMKK